MDSEVIVSYIHCIDLWTEEPVFSHLSSEY